MRYHNITKDDMNNGDGLRVVLWVSGCSHKCKGCQNPITWNAKDGLLFDEKAKKEIFVELEKDYIAGITLSGGDPLYKDNREEIKKLCKEVKERFPNKTIWLYTGYTLDQCIEDEELLAIVKLVDILVEGPFILEKKDTSLKWVGSSNQTVVDVKNSIIK